MEEKIIYTDKLVEITTDSILFRAYYFPFGKKRVAWPQVDTVEIHEPTIANGKYRIHGTGDFRTWFPRDGKRPTRDTIFIINLRSSKRRIGFTVEDTEKAIPVFESKGLLQDCRGHETWKSDNQRGPKGRA
jgi:hypothetical protein